MCVLCAKLRSRFINAAMETRHPNSYSIAQAFWIAQSDLFGPVQTNVLGREQNTRANPSLSAKYWVMVLAQGLSRMSCEVGTPARLLIDQDSAFMKVLKDAEVTNVDLETHMRVRATMDFLVKLFNMDELSWAQDMDSIRTICRDTNLSLAPNGLAVTHPPEPPSLTCGCCCQSHHALKPNDQTPHCPLPCPFQHQISYLTELRMTCRMSCSMLGHVTNSTASRIHSLPTTLP